jgi:hypothetical protein
MRTTHWIISLLVAASLCSAAAIAADAAPANTQSAKLESINGASAGNANTHDECPMHQEKKECQHKSGEPCPHHQAEKHHAQPHEKCEHQHPG